MLVLPGGMPGTKYLGEYQPLRDLLTDFYRKGGKVAAICAAPTVLASLGFLEGTKATAYPSCMEGLAGAEPFTGERCHRWQCDNQQRTWNGCRFRT